MKPDLKPGQKLWFVRTTFRIAGFDGGREVTVEKVGRLWATLSNHERVDANLRVDGGLAVCHLSQEHYRADLEVKAAWRSAWERLSRFSFSPPPGVTPDDIAAALKALRI